MVFRLDGCAHLGLRTHELLYEDIGNSIVNLTILNVSLLEFKILIWGFSFIYKKGKNIILNYNINTLRMVG